MNIADRDASTVSAADHRGQDWLLEPGEFAARVRRARREGRPRWLWPDIAVAGWRDALSRLARIAGALLTERVPPPLEATDLAGERALCLAAYTSGLGPWLGWHVEAGGLEVNERAARQLAEHLRQARLRWQRLRIGLAEVLSVLGDADCDVTVFKGAHTARLCFAEPALRPMADLDLHVRGGAIERAERALAAAGFREVRDGRLRQPRRSEWRPAFASVQPRSLMLVHADDGHAIDLHASLDIDFFGVRTVRLGQPSGEQLEQPAWLPAHATVLRAPLLLALHALHASQGLHGLTLIRLVEMTLLLRTRRASEGAEELGELLLEHEAQRFAFPALSLTEQLAPGTVDPGLLRACAADAPPRLRRIVGSVRPDTAQRLDGLALEERFMWGRGAGEHVHRIRHMLFPLGRSGSVSRLLRIYIERAFRLLRLRVRWRGRA